MPDTHYPMAQSALARWQQAGLLDLPDEYEYLGSLNAPQWQNERYGFQSFIGAQKTMLPDDAFGTITAVRLFGGAQWKDQVVLFIVLPLLRRNLSLGGRIPELLRLWLKAPLELSLRPSHVRTLAHQSVSRVGPSEDDLAILALYDVAGAPWRAIDHGGRLSLLNRCLSTQEHRALLVDAMRFWGSDALVPALVSHLASPIRNGNVKGLLSRLHFIARLLRFCGPAAKGPRCELPRALAALAASVPCEDVRVSPLWGLLGSFGRLCRLLSIRPTRLAPDWYRSAAALIEDSFKGYQGLRRAWAEDLASSLIDSNHGGILVPEIYSRWLDSDSLDGSATTGLTELCKSVPAAVLGRLEEILWFRLLAKVQDRRADLGRVVRQVLHTLRMLRPAVPPVLRSLLLARLLHSRRTIAEEIALMSEWAGSPRELDRVVAAAARTIPSTDETAAAHSLCLLLWEVLLASQGREVSLLARLQRAFGLARLEEAGDQHVAAIAAAMGMLGRPTSQGRQGG